MLLGACFGMGSAFIKNDMLTGIYFAIAILMGFHAIMLWLFLLVASDMRECHERLRAIQGEKPIGEDRQ
jgi:hypothetical protein